jgi:hypothetical protein
VENNPYLPPKASVEDRSEPLYSSRQIGLAAFLGGPVSAGWLARSNYRSMGEADAGHRIFLWSFAACAVFLVGGYFLPERFPRTIATLICALAIRSAAEGKFGDLVKKHREAGGLIASWWKVVGIGLLGMAGILLAVVAVVTLLLLIGVMSLPE